jgi:hypothetical protein
MRPASDDLYDPIELALVSGELLADIVPCLEHRPEIQVWKEVQAQWQIQVR